MSGQLLVRLHSLGDVVLASGTAVAMQSADALAFASRPEYEPVIHRIPGSVKMIPVSGGWTELRRISAGFSSVIDLQNNLTTRAAFSGRNVKRFAFSRKERKKVLSGAPIRLPWRALSYLRTWSDVDADPSPVLERRFYPQKNRFSVGIVAGGRWPMKSIPTGVVAELASLFCDIEGADVFVLGSPGDRSLSEHIVELCGYRSVYSVAGEGGVSELIKRVEGLDLLISPDSGPAHLAAALGVPVLVIFTSTSPSLGFWPEDFKGVFMAEPVSCRPCHRHGGSKCKTGDMRCRRMLVPRMIHEEAMCLLH